MSYQDVRHHYEEDPGPCEHNVPFDGDGCEMCEIKRLQKENNLLNEDLEHDNDVIEKLLNAIIPFAKMRREDGDPKELALKRGIASDATFIFSEDFNKAYDAYEEVVGRSVNASCLDCSHCCVVVNLTSDKMSCKESYQCGYHKLAPLNILDGCMNFKRKE